MTGYAFKSIVTLFAVITTAVCSTSCYTEQRYGANPVYSGVDPRPADKAVFMAVQPWYGNPIEGKSIGWYHWDFNNHYPADGSYLARNGKRDIASVQYPIIGAYDSSDLRVIDWQLDICKAMLIDCIMVDYYGDGLLPASAEYQYYKTVVEKIISRAELKDMKVVLLYETQIRQSSTVPEADILKDLNAIIDNRKWMNSKAYLHYNNTPVICIFGVYRLRHYEWSAIKNSLRGKVCLVADTQPYQYENPYIDNDAFNGCFKWDLYNEEIKRGANPDYKTVKNFADRLNNDCGWWVTQGSDRFAFSTIWPGFDDTAVDGWGNGPRVVDSFTSDRPDDNTSFFSATMDAALHPSYPLAWVMVATLNDWNESTNIEPSRELGYARAIKLKRFAEEFKGVPENMKKPDSIIQTITESYGFTYR